MKLSRAREARHLLSEVYGWFTEGLDTPDLREAKDLRRRLGAVGIEDPSGDLSR